MTNADSAQRERTPGSDNLLPGLKNWLNWQHGVVLLVVLNALLLVGVFAWVYFDAEAPSRSGPFLNGFRWWSQPWGEYVPVVADVVDSDESYGAAMLSVLLACLSLFLGVMSLRVGRWRQRAAVSVIACVLAVGWLFIGWNWDVLRLRGKGLKLTGDLIAVREFAVQLESDWPDQDGEIEGFGAFLAYPYGSPRTLLTLGETCVPGTGLRVAAVERTPGESIRFQLSGGKGDLWFEWRSEGTVPTGFTGGLQQGYTPKAYFEVSDQLFLVRYVPFGSVVVAEAI
ncbi:hypothetical protein AB1L42_00465 [Thalassoglobus sp. JC818]|uniref:hypothetical protein n=1 Tax=Thalassoglobus sp. JC818 TaxID=3232136 RepID=UPI00345ABED8